MASAVRTRQRSGADTKLVEFLGSGQELILSELPTLRGLLRYGLHLQEMKLLVEDRDKRNYGAEEMMGDVMASLVKQWQRANAQFRPPVTISDRAIIMRLLNAWRKVSDIARKRLTNKKDVEKVSEKLDRLFDITRCRCPVMTCDQTGECNGCAVRAHVKCVCPRDQKLPEIELAFLKAQREKVGEISAYQMGPHDVKETARQRKTLKRKEVDKEREERQLKKQREESKQDLQLIDDEIKDDTTVEEDETEEAGPSSVSEHEIPPSTSSRNNMRIDNIALASIRYGVSATATAAIATAALQDARVITTEDTSRVIDRSKVARAKSRMMKETQLETATSENDILCVFFDGRQDQTKVMVKPTDSNKLHPSVVKEEHYSVTREPGGEYLCHFSPEASPNIKHAEQVANELVEWLETHGVGRTLIAIGGDSTNTNTGWRGGVIQHVEKKLGRKLSWIICWLHLNELPLRHLITALDGQTSSDRTFTGPLGKLLPHVTKLPVRERFDAIPVNGELVALSPDVVKDLSTDQMYGYRMVEAISSGQLPTDLAHLGIGPIVHSRWLTTANRFLRLYVSECTLTAKEESSLKHIVTFIVQVYYPCWFLAKVKHSWLEGPRHLLTQLRLIRQQPEVVQDAVMQTVRSAAWHSHSECVLQTMLASQDREERAFAVKKILELRGESQVGDLTCRVRRLPKLNVDATSLSDLIEWDEAHEPVVTCRIVSEDLQKVTETPLQVPYLPVHTQSVERCVKLVTTAASSVYGHERRDGFIRAKMAHREMIPVFATKRDMVASITSGRSKR